MAETPTAPAPVLPVSLTPTAHKGYKVRQTSEVEYLKETHVAKIYTAEFVNACIDYPIVFIKDPESQEWSSVVMWGLQQGENLYVDSENKWAGGYVPSAVRCFPFTMASSPDDKDRIFIGVYESSKLLNKEEGEAIFNDDGTETEWFTGVKEFLGQVYDGEQRTRHLIEKLDSLELLVPQGLSIPVAGSEEPRRVDGFYVIDRKKFSEISDEEFLSFRKANVLDAIYAHWASLGNVEKTVQLKNISDEAKAS